MKPSPSDQVTRHDVQLTRRHLRRLTLPQKLYSLVIIIVGALLAWLLSVRLLKFGQTVDYQGLPALGPKTVSLLQQYNAIFWWTAVGLLGLLLLYVVYGLVRRNTRLAQGKLMQQNAAITLIDTLSPAGKKVLSWAWQNRQEPLSVAVLQRTLHETRSHRAEKIAMAAEQEARLSLQKSQHSSPKSRGNNP